MILKLLAEDIKIIIRGGYRKFRKRGPGQFQQKPLYWHVENL
jgi:hypothetical protein